MVLAECISVIASVKYRNKYFALSNFHWYPIAALVQSLICLTAFGIWGHIPQKIQYITINIFEVIEFLFIYSFCLRTLTFKLFRKIVKALLVVFFLYLLFMWIFMNAFNKYYEVYIAQSTFLLVPPVLFFLQTLKLPSNNTLLDEPAFWINIGILFFFSSTIPLFVLEAYFRNFINQNDALFSISYIAYGVFFLLITKAYLCKPTTKLSYSLSLPPCWFYSWWPW